MRYSKEQVVRFVNDTLNRREVSAEDARAAVHALLDVLAGGDVKRASIVPARGPDVLYRYNTYDSVTINGVPNAAGGYSSGDALDAMEEVAAATLPPDYSGAARGPFGRDSATVPDLTRINQCAVKGAFSQWVRFPPGNSRSGR